VALLETLLDTLRVPDGELLDESDPVLQEDTDTDDETDLVGKLLADNDGDALPLEEGVLVPLLETLVEMLGVGVVETLADNETVPHPEPVADKETDVVGDPLIEYEGVELPLVDREYVPLLDTVFDAHGVPDGEWLDDPEPVLQPDAVREEEADVVGESLTE
jgi:hypothetical protein